MEKEINEKYGPSTATLEELSQKYHIEEFDQRILGIHPFLIGTKERLR